jgi:hypothetical protein
MPLGCYSDKTYTLKYAKGELPDICIGKEQENE